ncbi:ankyrin repeat-containing domain protein [Xylaria cf. heliscus]|nr:ankyrin repeat-containing domain protein [Xylaria cf. heliscus]
MRAAFGTNYGISATILASYWYLRWFDLVAMEPCVDFVELLSCDLHGLWNKTLPPPFVITDNPNSKSAPGVTHPPSPEQSPLFLFHTLSPNRILQTQPNTSQSGSVYGGSNTANSSAEADQDDMNNAVNNFCGAHEGTVLDASKKDPSNEIYNAPDDRGRTPLACATKAGKVKAVAVLLASADVDVDVDVNARDYEGCMPLGLAARNGHAAVVAQLLARGANPNLRDLKQVTPLWHSAKQGHTAVVCLLLESGRLSDLNTQPRNHPFYKSDTPLAIAVREGHQETAALLARTDGVDPYIRPTRQYGHISGLSILGLSILNGYEDVALVLLDKCGPGQSIVEPASKLLHSADVNAVYVYARDGSSHLEQSPLMAASRRGHANVVRLLLDTEGISPDLSEKRDNTALILAARKGFASVVKMLLADPRVDANHKDHVGRTSLSHAAERAHEAAVAELLATTTVDPDSQDIKGRTPLIWASKEGVVRKLLASGRVNPNSMDAGGRTPICRAAEHGSLGLVKAILEHPKTDLDGGHRSTPLISAASSGRADVVRVLLETRRVDVNAIREGRYHKETALAIAACFGHQSVVQILLSTPGIDPDCKNKHGETPLMAAANRGQVEIVEQLLGVASMDPNIQDGQDRSLSLAAENGDVQRVDTLLAVGANPDARDAAGGSPLLWAFTYNRVLGWKINERKEVVRRLLRMPAVDPDAEEDQGLTPLLRSIQYSYSSEFVELLLARADLDVNRRGRHGLRPLALVQETDDTVVLAASESLDQVVREELAREYRLPLGAQQEYANERAAESVASLCEVCAAIDLEAAFSTRHTKHRGRVTAKLGKVDITLETRKCTLCRLFAAVRPRPDVSEGHKLVSFSTTQSWLCHEELTWLFGFEEEPWVDTMVLAVVADSVLSRLSDFPFLDYPDCMLPFNHQCRDSEAIGMVDGVFSTGLISRLGSNCSCKSNTITTPRLAADRSWIQCCRQNHSRRCNPPGLSTVPHFRLIECATQRVVEQNEFEATGTPIYDRSDYHNLHRSSKMMTVLTKQRSKPP